jgi:hypothetical protein
MKAGSLDPARAEGFVTSRDTDLNNEIDRLYQLPLAEFTAARNALAKQRGADGAAIRTLEKPNLAAWAVNQLYWQERPIFNRLIAAAEARHKAHAKLLSGKESDVAAAETAHSTAVRAAADAVRTILADTGHDQSPATTHAVNDTLQALPGSGTPGRLTEPLKLAGFEALAGLVKGGQLPKLVQKTPAPEPLPASAPDRAKREAAEEKRAEATRKRERQVTDHALREARKDAKAAESALNSSRRVLAQAKEERQRLQDQLQFAIKKIDDASTAVREGEQKVARATQEQARLEAKLETLRD